MSVCVCLMRITHTLCLYLYIHIHHEKEGRRRSSVPGGVQTLAAHAATLSCPAAPTAASG